MAGFFTKIFSRKKSPSVIGIDIGTSAIKVVQLRKQGEIPVLETYGSLALGPYAGKEIGRATNLEPSQISDAIQTLLSEARVTSRDSGASIPFGASLMSITEMPRLSDEELAQVMPIEARKYIPVPISEVTFDWWIIPKNENKIRTPKVARPEKMEAPKEEKIDVLIVAIHNQTIEKYTSMLDKAGVKPDFFEIEVFSAVRSVLDPSPAPMMVVDIGAAATKLYIVESGVVKGSHIINRGSQDITLALSQALGVSVTKAEELKRTKGLSATDDRGVQMSRVVSSTLHYIFAEIRRILDSYQRKQKDVVEKIVFTGGGALLSGLQIYAQENFETQVQIGDPFARVEAPAFVQEILHTTGPEFSVALGLALRKLQETKE